MARWVTATSEVPGHRHLGAVDAPPLMGPPAETRRFVPCLAGLGSEFDGRLQAVERSTLPGLEAETVAARGVDLIGGELDADDLDRLLALRAATSDNAPVYLAVVGILDEATRAYRLQPRTAEIRNRLNDAATARGRAGHTDRSVDGDDVDLRAALDQLRQWGCVEWVQDPAVRAISIDDDLRRHELWELTAAGHDRPGPRPDRARRVARAVVVDRSGIGVSPRRRVVPIVGAHSSGGDLDGVRRCRHPVAVADGYDLGSSPRGGDVRPRPCHHEEALAGELLDHLAGPA